MAKTQLTRDIEEALYFYGLEQGEIIVEEVSMPDDRGVVDTLACRTKPDGTHEWRCYELKVSKSDFRSTAKISFIGHYNYYVMPKPLYDAIKDEIPNHVGVMVYLPFDNERDGGTATKGSLSIIKKASRQELLVDEGQLMNSFLHSLFREVRKAKKLEKGLQLYRSDDLIKELSKRYIGYDVLHPERSFYDAFIDEIEQEAVKELRDELEAAIAESNELKEKMRQGRRMTEPYLYRYVMYIPYFRGKQFDLLALTESVVNGLLAEGIIPLVEPVRDSAHLRRTLEAFIENEREILVIDNPEVGQVQRGVVKIHEINDLFDSPYVTPVYLLNSSFNPAWIKQKDFVFLSKSYFKDILAEVSAYLPRFHIVADSARLRRAVPDNRVLLTDPFTCLKHGEDYSELEDEFYTDDSKYILEDGYIGYSNYGIDGEAYSDKGFPSRCILLHILYLDQFKSVRIKHFVSDSNETAANPRGKFFEALKKLADWHSRYEKEVPLTRGLDELLSYQGRETYPGTGIIKKISVMHQLELMFRTPTSRIKW